MGKKLFVLIALVIIVFGCGSDDAVQPRSYEVSGVDILYSGKACYIHYEALGYDQDDIATVCGVDILDKTDQFQYDYIYYQAKIWASNSEKNSAFVKLFITRDDGYVITDQEIPASAAIIDEFEGIYGVDYEIYMISFYLNLSANDKGHGFTVESWITDSNGVPTSVYARDIYATPII